MPTSRNRNIFYECPDNVIGACLPVETGTYSMNAQIMLLCMPTNRTRNIFNECPDNVIGACLPVEPGTYSMNAQIMLLVHAYQ